MVDRAVIEKDSKVAAIAIDEFVTDLLPRNLDTRSLYYWSRLSVIRAAMNAQGHGNWCTVRFKTHFLRRKIEAHSSDVVVDYILMVIKLYHDKDTDAKSKSNLENSIKALKKDEALPTSDPVVFTWDVESNIHLLERTKTMKERLTLGINEFQGKMLFAKNDPFNLAGEIFSDTPTNFVEKMKLLLTKMG